MSHRWGSPSAAGMSPHSPQRRPPAVAVAMLALLLGLAFPAVLAGPANAAARETAAKGTGQVYVIHGIVGRVLDIYVDGKKVLGAAQPKSIVGPLSLDAGSHQVALSAQGTTVAQTRFTVGAGQSLDVVAHLRSDSSMTGTVTAFRNDVSPVGPGKLRLAVAHVAAAPPADILVNGDVLFSDVASGEALTVVVPASSYTVEIVPAATNGAAILGPVHLTLKKATLTRVFAIGSVATGSMDAIVHSVPVTVTGAAAPRSVPTGDGGQAASQFVVAPSRTTEAIMASALALLGMAVLVALAARHTARKRLTL